MRAEAADESACPMWTLWAPLWPCSCGVCPVHILRLYCLPSCGTAASHQPSTRWNRRRAVRRHDLLDDHERSGRSHNTEVHDAVHQIEKPVVGVWCALESRLQCCLFWKKYLFDSVLYCMQWTVAMTLPWPWARDAVGNALIIINDHSVDYANRYHWA